MTIARNILLISVIALALLFVGAYVVSAGHNADGLVGYWALDDGLDPTADGSGHGYDGGVEGAVFPGTGAPVPGSVDSLDFDGVDDIVTVSDEDDLDVSDEMTVSFWFMLDGESDDNAWPRPVTKGQTTTTDGAYGVFVKDASDPEDIGLRFVDTGGTTHDIRNSSIAGGYDDSEWHHVAATYSNSGDVGKLYLDGAEIASVAIAGDVAIRPTTDDLTIGGGTGDADRHFNGKVDEVRIYSRVLSDLEIAVLGGEYAKISGRIGGESDKGKGKPTHTFKGLVANLDGSAVGEVMINYKEEGEVCTFTPDGGTLSISDTTATLEDWENDCDPGIDYDLTLDDDPNRGTITVAIDGVTIYDIGDEELNAGNIKVFDN